MPRRSILLVLFLVFGLVFGPGLSAAAAPDMRAATASAMNMNMAMGQPTTDMCNKCMKKESAAHACYSHCASIQAIIPKADPWTVVLSVSVAVPKEQRARGSSQRPDLPPPKSSWLV